MSRFSRSASSVEREHVMLLLTVARLYYENGATQAEIAKKIGYSRPTVSRLLTEAREQGVVHIRITHPLERAMQIEKELAAKFGLKDVRIADNSDVATIPQQVARCAADYIVENSRDNLAIAVSNGYAVNATIEAMPQLGWHQSRVFQMIGSVGTNDILLNSPETCRRMASALGGRHYALPSPLVVANTQVAEALRQSNQVEPILELAARSDLALVGIGTVSPGPSSHNFDDYADAETQEILERQQAVGHLCGHHFDAEGRHIRTPLCDRTIGLDMERLKTLPRVVGVAWGESKLQAIRGAVLGGYISVLVTDRETAIQLLDMP